MEINIVFTIFVKWYLDERALSLTTLDYFWASLLSQTAVDSKNASVVSLQNLWLKINILI